MTDVVIDIGICETAEDDPRRFALLRNEGDASGNLVVSVVQDGLLRTLR